jgi:hypothetical protein
MFQRRGSRSHGKTKKIAQFVPFAGRQVVWLQSDVDMKIKFAICRPHVGIFIFV